MKKTFKFYTAMFLAKCANKSLKLLRRNASYFPGNLALKICPNFLEQIDKPPVIIGVTGTNGKTTTRVDGVNKKSLKQTKILKVKKLKNRKVRITFKKISKAKIYRIQYSTDRKFKKNVRTKRTRKNTYLLRKLRVRKRYYVRVRAIVGKDKGKWSSVKSFKVR